jgi:hypothetical protein
MKKTFILGMVVLAASMSFSTSHAAGVKSLREALVDYTRDVKDFAAGKKSSGKEVSSKTLGESERMKILIEKLDDVSREQAQKISTSIGSDSAKKAERISTLASIVAGQELMKGYEKSISERKSTELKLEPAEIASIKAATKASASLLANASLTGAFNSVGGSRGHASVINNAEMAEATAALHKLEKMPEIIITKFSTAERDSYTQIINRHDQLTQDPSMRSSEEAFVKAIMDVKKVDKDKAMEIVKKLKECV